MQGNEIDDFPDDFDAEEEENRYDSQAHDAVNEEDDDDEDEDD
jgi:hypothetical protein